MINEENLPKEWQELDLKDIVFFQEGPGIRKWQFTHEGIKLINVKNIVNGSLKLDNTDKYCSNEEVKERYEHFLLNNNDIVMASSGVTWGKTAIVKKENLPLMLNTSVIRFKSLDENVLIRGYLLLFLNSVYFKRQIERLITGGCQPNFGPSHLKKVKFILPPLETQKKIVEILQKAEKLKEWRVEADEFADEFLKSVFLDMFGDPVNNYHNFKIGKIGDLVIKTQYGTSKKANEEKDGCPILRMNNISYSGKWDFSSLKHIELDESEKEKYLVNKGELLFNRTNSKELVGKSAVYRKNESMAFAGYLVKLSTDSPATSEYIAGYLNSPYGKAFLFSMAKSIVGMANINAKEVQRIPILIPPMELREKYAKIVNQVENLRENQKQSKKQIDNLFNALMQKTFKGELTC